MAGVKHAMTSTVVDAGTESPDLVGPNQWNADHVVEQLNVGDDTLFSGLTAPPQITSNQDNYNPTDLAITTVLRLTTDAARNITGLVGGIEGRFIILQNAGAFNINLMHDQTSTAANRFLCPDNATATIPRNGTAILSYDDTADRWRVNNGGSGGTGGSKAFSFFMS